MFPRLVVLPWLLALGAVMSARADEPVADPGELPRVPPTPSERAAATFKVRPGFHLDLVASEPLVVSPVAVAFDEQGRCYVVEMRDYSERRPERLGRIRRLEDTDGDGRYDKATVFLEDLPWPTAVVCYGGGVFVGATPDILFAKDTNGDGKADLRETVFTGFASDYAPFATNKLNVQALMNSFLWGLDNRIHGAGSMSGGKVQMVDSDFTRKWRNGAENRKTGKQEDVTPKTGGTPGAAANSAENRAFTNTNAAVELHGRDFSFDPWTLEFRAETSGGQHGMSFDDTGRKFVCSNSDHLQLVVFDERYHLAASAHPLPSPRVSIAVDGPAAEVFRVSPDEPWRVLRTKWRVAGITPGLVEGGGRPSGYFTGATGATIYRGDSLGPELAGDAFIADCGSNLIHRKKLRPDGVLLRGERAADEQKSEFAASTDNWFRPVQFANAPDGCLWVIDMYREVIEHPWSLPSGIKQHLDLNSGNDHGRLWRIVPDGFTRPAPRPDLAGASTAELVAALAHPNGWHRDTAARLIYERPDSAAVPMLERLMRSSTNALGRLHALHALEGLGALSDEVATVALADASPAVRRHAVAIAERSGNTRALARVPSLATDPDPLVRFQVALTARALPTPSRVETLAAILRRDADHWIQEAALFAVGDSAGGLLKALVEPGSSLPDRDRFLPLLAGLIGRQNRAEDVEAVIGLVEVEADHRLAVRLAGALGDGLQGAGSSLTQADRSGRLLPVLRESQRQVESAASAGGARDGLPEALHLLGQLPYEVAGPVMLQLVKRPLDEASRRADFDALARYDGTAVATGLLNDWSQLPLEHRREAVELLLRRRDRTALLLAAIDSGRVAHTDLGAPQIAALRNHPDSSIRDQSVRLFGVAIGSRADAVAAMVPALRLAGDATHGQALYLAQCANCHRLAGQGHALGPDLESVVSQGKEKLLVNILDPNREVAPNFFAYTVETREGDSFSGILVAESPASVTVRQAGGIDTVLPRDRLKRLEAHGRSLMPEGLESGLSKQDFADLLEYVTTAK